MFKEELNVQHIRNFLEDERNVKSSRVKEVLKVVNKHGKEKLIIFTSFRRNLDIVKHFL